MSRICVLSGNEEEALREALGGDFEAWGLIPLCGTSLSNADLVVVTECAATHSIGAESALRRLLVSAVCRGVPVVFLVREGRLPVEFLRYGQWLLCVDGVCGAGESEAELCHRYGLRDVRIFEDGTPPESIYGALNEICRKILISEDKQNVKTNRA